MVNETKLQSPYGKLDDCLKITNEQSTEVVYNFGDILELDQEYTFSCWFRADSEIQISIQISNERSRYFPVTSEWQKLSFTASANTATSKKVFFTIPANNTLYAYEGMLELGNIASDFKPSEKDIENVVTTLQTNFTVQQGKIESLIKETTIDNGDGTTTSLKDAYNQTKQTVEGNKTTIANVQTKVNTLTGDVESIKSNITEIEQTAEGIKTQVSSVDSTANNAMSLAEQNASKFTWIVKSGTSSTDFTLTDRTAQLVADSINLHGLVTFKGLDSSTQNKINNKANQSIIDNWAKDSIVGGETTINGGYIKTNTIKTDQLSVDDIFATGSAAMNIINAQEINANRITSGQLSAERINVYGLSVLNKDNNQQTFSITNNGEVTIKGSVSSSNYNIGKTGWAINNDGTAEFNDIVARGSIITNDGGIVSSGGSGRNLLINSNFAKYYIGDSFTVNDITYNTYANGYGGYNGGIDNPKINYHAYLDTKTNHIVFDETNGSKNWKGISPDNSTFPALVDKNITSLTLSMQTKASDSGTYVFGGFYYTKKGGTDRAFHAGQFNELPPKGEARISTVVKLGSDVDWSKDVRLFIYGYGFSTNSKLEIWDLKLEEGDVATDWSPAPEDKLKQVRFWAGTSFEERESAPFIVYSDGSIRATQGEYSGLWTGDIKIGNISIIDPSASAGNDALLTIQNGSDGVKRVQLTDNTSSSFAQDIIITNNTYSPMISLKQDGSAYYSKGINIADTTTLNSTSLIINNKTLTTTSNGSGFLFNNELNVGTVNQSANLIVHGNVSTDNITVDSTLYFGDVLKFTKNANGINIDFI